MRAFFLPIRKKILACIQILFKLEINFQSKQIVLFCFVFFSLGFCFCFLFFNFFLILCQFIILFLWGMGVFLSIACPRLLIPSLFDIFFKKSHICQRNTIEIVEENNQCLRFCHRMYFTQRTYHERKEIS